jgi:hypothetical protein
MSAAPWQAFDPPKDLLDHDREPLRDPLGILAELKADINAFAVLLRPVRSQEQHQELIAPGRALQRASAQKSGDQYVFSLEAANGDAPPRRPEHSRLAPSGT